MSPPQFSHAYGIGLVTLVVAACAVVVFYQSYYLPESLARPSVSHEILEAGFLNITILPGALDDNNIDYSKLS